MTLTEFLEARIAEDVASAVAATLGPWRYDPSKVNAVDRGEAVFAGEGGASAVTVASTGPADDQQSMSDAAHITRFNPARILAECEAKRKIVADRDRIDRSADGDEWSMGYSDANYGAMHALAVIYADHPDYQPEWRP